MILQFDDVMWKHATDKLKSLAQWPIQHTNHTWWPVTCCRSNFTFVWNRCLFFPDSSSFSTGYRWVFCSFIFISTPSIQVSDVDYAVQVTHILELSWSYNRHVYAHNQKSGCFEEHIVSCLVSLRTELVFRNPASHLFSHNHLYIAKCLFAIRDD